jgi:hypothetical protein
MAEERPLGDLLRELAGLLGQYVRQNAAEAVREVLLAPLREAARRAVLLGLAVGLGAMAALCLALASFNVLAELFGRVSAAWAVTCILCLALGVLCAWAVRKGAPDVREAAGGAKGTRRGRGAPVGAGPGAAEPRSEPEPADPGAG